MTQLKDITPGSTVRLTDGKEGLFHGLPLECLPYGAGTVETESGEEILVYGQDEATVIKGVDFSGANKDLLVKAQNALYIASQLLEIGGNVNAAITIKRYADEIKNALQEQG